MSKVLLLYDTREKDLARDIQDLLKEIISDVVMIPSEPGLGKTLEDSEASYFGDADGAVFLIMPGCERDGRPFPSPSVADEMGRAKQRFETAPQRVIYLVDRACKVQSVDQRSYIGFDRHDMRSVLEAVTTLLRGLKAAKLTSGTEIAPRDIPNVDVEGVAAGLSERLADICLAMSDLPDGAIAQTEFRQLLKTQFSLTDRDINFAQRDLQVHGLINSQSTPGHPDSQVFVLTSLGWEVVRQLLKPKITLWTLIEAYNKWRGSTQQ